MGWVGGARARAGGGKETVRDEGQHGEHHPVSVVKSTPYCTVRVAELEQ